MGRRAAIVIFVAALALCALITKPHATSWNDISRLATIDALVTHHTVAIDDSPFAAKTMDKYRFRGRTYSDKPPALALQGAAVAALLVPFGITLAGTPDRAVYLITLTTAGVWFALGCAYAYAFQRLLGFEHRLAALVAALTGLGTLALPYAIVLANHVPAGAAAIAGMYHLVRARQDRAVHAFLGGAFLAVAYAFDAPAMIFAPAAAIVLWGAPLRLWLAFAVAAVPVVAAQLAFNASVSSGWAPPALNQATWSDPASPFHRADQSLLHFSGAADYARYAAYLVVGGKGLVTYTPLVLLAAWGFVRMWGTPQRRIAAALVTACVAYFILMVAFTNDYGALNYGERRYVDVMFVLCAGVGPALAALPPGAAVLAARVAAAWSMALAMLGTIAPFGEPRGVEGAAFAAAEFVRLAHRAPLQAGIDVVAFAVMILLVQRAWWSPAVPTSGTGPRAA